MTDFLKIKKGSVVDYAQIEDTADVNTLYFTSADGTFDNSENKTELHVGSSKVTDSDNINQIEILYEDLIALRNGSQLVPGMKYRITDFTTYKTTYHITKIGNEVIPTYSERHPFDVIVTASSNNTLNAKASAALNKFDNYFSHFSCDLERWELEYEIEPDENILDDYYKGTITYMKDERGNEATYDFKNIVFDVSDVEVIPDYLDTKLYGSNKRRPLYTFSRLIQNISEINGINLTYSYYADNNFVPDCYVADASLCDECDVVLYNGRTVNLSFYHVENNVIKLKDEYKALFACTSAYFDGVTLKYGVKTSYYTFDIEHKSDHNLIINSYGNAYDKNGASVFIIGSTTSFINVNGMSGDNHCMNLSNSYVCVNENGKQILDLSNLQQRLDNINENYYNLSDQLWNLSDNDDALATRISEIENNISSLGTRISNTEQHITDTEAELQGIIAENFKSSKEIIPFTDFENVTATINENAPDDDSGVVVYDMNLNTFLYKIDDAYYRNWYDKDMYIGDDELIGDKIYFCTDLSVLCAVKLSNSGLVLTPMYQNPVGQDMSICPNSRIIINSINDTELNFSFKDVLYNQNYTSEIDIYFDANYSELPTVAFPDVIKWNTEPTFNIGKHYSIVIECIILDNVKHYTGVWAEFDF